MAKCADTYVKSKNEPIMHRRGESKDVKFTDRLVYFIPESDHEHTIDVYCQQTHKIRGWTGTSYQEESTLVRLFRFVEYKSGLVEDMEAPENEAVLKKQRVAQAKKMNLTHTSSATLGGFPASILASLEQSERFKQSRAETEQNRIPSRQALIFVSPDDGDDSPTDEE